jgi:hypothetical protein
MASVVRIKRSAVQGKAPRTSDLETGELALNTRDGKLFSTDGSSVFEIGANTEFASIGTLTLGNTNPYTLPSEGGEVGQILKTDSSGNLAWAYQSNTASTSEYVYNATQGQTVFTGADSSNSVLTYNSSTVDVYLNGIKLIKGRDFFANTGNSIVLDDGAEEDDTLSVVSQDTKTNFVSAEADLITNTHTTSTTSTEIIDTFGLSDARSAKYMVQIEVIGESNSFQVSEVLMVHNGSASFVSETNVVTSDSRVANISSDVSNGAVRLKVTPISSVNLKTRFSRLTLSI